MIKNREWACQSRQRRKEVFIVIIQHNDQNCFFKQAGVVANRLSYRL